jgi:hypothetical protein
MPHTTRFVAATALLAIAGCGGGGRPAAPKTIAKAELIRRGGAICKAAERKVNALPQITTQHPFGKGTSTAEQQRARRFLVGYAAALDGSRRGLEALVPQAPAAGKSLLVGYLRDTGTVVSRLRAASAAARPKVEAEAQQAFALFDKASRQTAAYGFPKGVCGSGSSS